MHQLLAVISIATLCSRDVFNDENQCRKKEALMPHGMCCTSTLRIERFSEVLPGTNCNSFVNNVCTEPDFLLACW